MATCKDATTAAAQHVVEVPDNVTTFMFRGIPRKYTAWDLIAVLERSGSREQFDFVYVPWYKTANSNMGYAFVNFVDPATARAVHAVMQGRHWGPSHGARTMNLMPAQVQGLEDNLRQYSLKNGTDFELVHRPLVFREGRQIDLQETVRKHCHERRASSPSCQTPPKSPQSVPVANHSELWEAACPRAPVGVESSPPLASCEFHHRGGSPHGSFELMRSDGVCIPLPPGLEPPKDTREDGLLGCLVPAGRLQMGSPRAGTTGNADLEHKHVHLGQFVATERHQHSFGLQASNGCSEKGLVHDGAAGSAADLERRPAHLGQLVATAERPRRSCGPRAMGDGRCEKGLVHDGGAGGAAQRRVLPAFFASCASAADDVSRRSTACPSSFGSDGSAGGHSAAADEILESPAYAAAWQRVNVLLETLQAGGAGFRRRPGERQGAARYQ
mmetsp:Transcript_4505/g.12462  ORF Transcript_4505/g.12462 Transcript_4505/m.12462 type:complete len:443 (-) Transcript_4505:59-1387(-)